MLRLFCGVWFVARQTSKNQALLASHSCTAPNMAAILFECIWLFLPAEKWNPEVCDASKVAI
jgi:hypothetical protein